MLPGTSSIAGFLLVRAPCIDPGQRCRWRQLKYVTKNGSTFFQTQQYLLFCWVTSVSLSKLWPHLIWIDDEMQWTGSRRSHCRHHHQTAILDYVSLLIGKSEALLPNEILTQAEIVAMYAALAAHKYWRSACATQANMLSKAMYVLVKLSKLDHNFLANGTRRHAYVVTDNYLW